MLIAFARGPIVAEGARVIAQATDPAWFEAWRSGSLRTIAETDLGPALAALDAADHLALVDGHDLAAAWATVRALVEAGASTVLDVYAQTYYPAATLAARVEVRVVFETTSERDDGAHALHTRGLTKFGAPDLIALCSKADAALVGAVIRQLADALVAGAILDEPRHAVALSPTTTWYVVDDRDGLAALLQLNNRAGILVDSHGRHLVGAVAGLGTNAS